ncbi:unnamed protein product [Oreochromis niloticus]|nr:unnamed protein product [Mustela putorius furo]
MDPRLLLLLLWSSGAQACNELISKESVRLVGGASRCAGTLELKHLGEWRPAVVFVSTPKAVAVICEHLACGSAVSVGRREKAPHRSVWWINGLCVEKASALWSFCVFPEPFPFASELTCSGVRAEEKHKPTEIVRLVGGASRCAGTLELKHLGEWRPAVVFPWSYKALTLACEHLDCGAAVSLRTREEASHRSVVQVSGPCVQAASAFWGVCLGPHYESFPVQIQILDLTCTDSVRLLNGSSLCSGRLEVKSNQSWSSVCEADFDQQDAEVVCRQLGCGPPLGLQGALYGEVEAPVWSKEFQCGGHESALLDCRSSGSARNSCSPGKAVGLTCSEPVRLEGGASRCDGVLELKHLGQWRPAESLVWSMETVAVFCEHLGCGSAVSFRQRKIPQIRAVWSIFGQCLLTTSTLQDCVFQYDSDNSLYLTCSDLLVQPIISLSSINGVSGDLQQGLQVSSGSSFTISCSIQSQYPGGSFQLNFTSSNTATSYTQPAVNHAANFLFPAAEPAHQGNYSCVYHVYILSRNVSSESHQLTVTVSG